MLAASSPPFRNKRFVLNEMFQQNSSNFDRFFCIRKPTSLFSFFISFNISFPFMNALVYVDIGMEYFIEQKTFISKEWGYMIS